MNAYRQGEPDEIIERLAEAVFAGVARGRELVDEMRAVRRRWSGDLTARSQAAVWRALDVVLRQPVLDSALLQRELDVNAQAANAAIERLVDIGALAQFTEGRRNRRFEAPEVLAALDAFAERGGRRRPGH